MTMASSVEVTAPLKQKTPAPTGQDTLTVLNAVSNLTVQRTIVEAFVKLVVCRKVTVQRVEAASGHVLDSHTTQVTDMRGVGHRRIGRRGEIIHCSARV